MLEAIYVSKYVSTSGKIFHSRVQTYFQKRNEHYTFTWAIPQKNYDDLFQKHNISNCGSPLRAYVRNNEFSFLNFYIMGSTFEAYPSESRIYYGSEIQNFYWWRSVL